MLNKFILILIKYVYTKENKNKIKLKSGVKNYIESILRIRLYAEINTVI